MPTKYGLVPEEHGGDRKVLQKLAKISQNTSPVGRSGRMKEIYKNWYHRDMI
jgi:hypothetical protein